MIKQNVVIGFLGSQLDSGFGAGRWNKWRPTVSLTQQPDMVVNRLELLYSPMHTKLARLIKTDIESVSPETEVCLHEVYLENPWDFEQVYGALYDWVHSYTFDTESENYLTHITTGTHVAQICLFLLVEARFIPSVLLQTSPSYQDKDNSDSLGTYTLIDLDLSRFDALAARFEKAQKSAVDFLKSGIATRNQRFNALIEEIEYVALRSRSPVLLAGPTGAGKSFLARRIFELKKSRHQITGLFVEVNCATLRGDSATSTLFGHKKGAFTGAQSDRAGLLRTADQGLLFLDEIAELGLDEQAMLLKAIEEKRFFPVGSDVEVQSHFQLIAGTNRDLRLEVACGRFREDLFSRINLWTYALPSLTKRSEDIEPNIEHLLILAAQETGQSVRFNTEAKTHYLKFAQSPNALWSGNFRDLSASITRLAILAENGRISKSLVEQEIERLQWIWDRKSPKALGNHRDDAMIIDDLNHLINLNELNNLNEPSDLNQSKNINALTEFFDEKMLLQIDYFDQLQLQSVIKICKESKTLSEAGRKLYNVSREQRSVNNDADRLRKYLHRFGLNWSMIQQ